METLTTILKIAAVAGCGAGVVFLGVYVWVFWGWSEAICLVINKVLEFITKPFTEHLEDFKGFIESKFSFTRNWPISRFADRHPTLGTGRSIRFFIISVIAICVITGVSILNNTFEELFSDVITMFPFFFIIDIFAGEAELTLVGLISTGISAFIMGGMFGFGLKGYKRKGYFLRWLVAIPYYIVTTILGCYLGYLLSHVWEWFAQTGIDLFNTMKQSFNGDGSFLGGIFAIACLIVITYIGILILITAVREYVETFCYGLIGFGIFIAFIIVSLILGGQAFFNTELFKTLAIILALFGIFGVDFMRVNKEELVEKHMR